MEDIYVHQYTKEELNWFTDGTVISTDAHTHSPLIQTLSLYSILEYLAIYIYLEGE